MTTLPSPPRQESRYVEPASFRRALMPTSPVVNYGDSGESTVTYRNNGTVLLVNSLGVDHPAVIRALVARHPVPKGLVRVG